jgi:alpha-beta hydrolase superfamily lysophospholipase
VVQLPRRRSGRHHDRLPPGARHEVFNETNRDEITDNLLAWLARFPA